MRMPEHTILGVPCQTFSTRHAIVGVEADVVKTVPKGAGILSIIAALLTPS